MAGLEGAITSWMRGKAKVFCSIDDCEDVMADDLRRIQSHLHEKHSEFLRTKDINQVVADLRKGYDQKLHLMHDLKLIPATVIHPLHHPKVYP